MTLDFSRDEHIKFELDTMKASGIDHLPVSAGPVNAFDGLDGGWAHAVELAREGIYGTLSCLISSAFDSMQADGTHRLVYEPDEIADQTDALWAKRRLEIFLSTYDEKDDSDGVALYNEELPSTTAADDTRPSTPRLAPADPYQGSWWFDRPGSKKRELDAWTADQAIKTRTRTQRKHDRLAKAASMQPTMGDKRVVGTRDDEETIQVKIERGLQLIDSMISSNLAKMHRLTIGVCGEDVIVARTAQEIAYEDEKLKKARDSQRESHRLALLRGTRYASAIGSSLATLSKEGALSTLRRDNRLRKPVRPYNPNRSRGWNGKPANDNHSLVRSAEW